jgi:hypothetical protein
MRWKLRLPGHHISPGKRDGPDLPGSITNWAIAAIGQMK